MSCHHCLIASSTLHTNGTLLTGVDSVLSCLESQQSSRRWTSEADEKEMVAFVRPHPPQVPSSKATRRRPRVKSAGSDQTPPASATGDRQLITKACAQR